jgi:GT2 family glycosyltransferase
MITVIMPVRNEVDYIERSFGSVLAQDYPPDLMEILVVDGRSDDGTREKVQKIIGGLQRYHDGSPSNNGGAQRFPKTYLLDNPGQIVPTALNIGLRQAKGEIIIRVDGHCEIAPDYVRSCWEVLEKTGADNVGGLQRVTGENLVSLAISLATRTPFGIGNAKFRYSKKAEWVDTVYLGAYRREIFERIGNFDENLVRNQDDEFNFRLSQAGGRIWLDPSIKVTYYSRNTFRRLWKQYFQYGFYKVQVIQKRRAVQSWRNLAPISFILALILVSCLSLINGNSTWVFAVITPYLLVNILSSAWVARHNLSALPLLTIIFPILHLSYGIGFLCGLWRLRHCWKCRSLSA